MNCLNTATHISFLKPLELFVANNSKLFVLFLTLVKEPTLNYLRLKLDPRPPLTKLGLGSKLTTA